jgi:PAT family beta-lactamase induction signal transducer AmpG
MSNMPVAGRDDKDAGRRLGAMLALGFASGLPLALTSGTLQAWLTVEGIDVRTIGLFALVGLPYTFKFLWSPVMDRYNLPWLSRRRDWMLLTQAGLVAVIALMAFWTPARGVTAVASLAVLVALLSASQDVVYDAYRADALRPAERGLGTGLSVSGYRIAMLVSGALALVLAAEFGWRDTYLLMAALMLFGAGATLWAPAVGQVAQPPRDLVAAVIEPFAQFLRRERAPALLGLIVLYKLGDACAGSLTTTFLIRELGFTIAEVGVINKGAGLAATLIGALAGGVLMTRLKLYRALLLFGILQAVTNLGFFTLTLIGKSYAGMTAVVVLENLAGGMGTSAFVALLMALCDRRYSATQYALLSALAALGRVLVGAPSGYAVAAWGWGAFFLLTVLLALPALGLLRMLRRVVSIAEAR